MKCAFCLTQVYEFCTTEHALLLNSIVCPGRQLKFEVFRNIRTKIGLNSLSNKFHHITKLIKSALMFLILALYISKKLAKVQFKKNGK